MTMKKTICDLVKETIDITEDQQIIKNLLQIKERAERMEDRLLRYCNVIEGLGFERVGRDYTKQ